LSGPELGKFVEVTNIEPLPPPVIDLRELLDSDAPRPRKPPHRLPEGVPKATMRRLERRIKQRLAGETTQQRIADEFGISQTRAWRLEQYVKVGWSLLRSDPDFRIISANDGLVYLPPLKKAQQIRVSERRRRGSR
jgi:hypothetical protein